MNNLTSKELSYIEDQLKMEQLLTLKFKAVAAMTSDPEIANKCKQISDKHQEHFNRLMTYLN